MLEHSQMALMRAKHPDWIWNRSDTHVILGVPGSLEGLKTVVEPGNSFSPGPGSFGVSTWVFDHESGKLHAPEKMDLSELRWRLLDGCIPVLISEWRAGDLNVSSRLFTDGDASSGDIKDYLTVKLENKGARKRDFSFYLVIRCFGAAGGPVSHLALSENGYDMEVNHFPLIYPSKKPSKFGAISYSESEKDISQFLFEGNLPEKASVEDRSTWASGALEYELSLDPEESKSLSFVFPVKTNNRFLRRIKPPVSPLEVEKKETEFTGKWNEYLKIKLDVPDERFRDAFYAQLAHLYMFTVYDSPRICPISYPIWWLRDGAYVICALDKGGFHEFAERACKNVMHRDAFGGFGSEGDGPGEAIWMLTEHYLLTQDNAYLKEVYPHILRKTELIMRMRRAKEPVRLFTEFCLPRHALSADTDILCLAARDGLINGRMDHGLPVFWVSGFSYLGLMRAALCARVMDDVKTAQKLEDEAGDLRKAIEKAAVREFGKNPRDVTSALWPTLWASKADPLIRERFQDFWNRVRFKSGNYSPEKLWTYFEAGQAHNYIFLGDREKAWVSIEHFLSNHIAPGLYTYNEGSGDENSFCLWQHTRGWDRIRYVTPHGWTAAELLMLLRDCMVYESGESLVIGAGVPESWVKSGKPFGISNVPTYFGKISWIFYPDDERLETDVERPPAGGIVVAIPGVSQK